MIRLVSGCKYLTSDLGFLADHLSYTATDTKLLGNAVYGYMVKLMSEMAKVVGEDSDAARYAELFSNIKTEWNATYVDAETHKTKTSAGIQDTQASYSLPLEYGLFSDENIPYAAARLAEVTKEATLFFSQLLTLKRI